MYIKTICILRKNKIYFYKLILLFLMIFCFNEISYSQNSHKNYLYQWQIRKTVFGEKVNEKNVEVYEIYYWDNKTNQKKFIWYSTNKPKIYYIDNINTEIIIDEDNKIYTQITSSCVDLWYKNGIEPYQYSKKINSFSIGNDRDVLVLPEKSIDIPKFSRVLQKETNVLFGDDVSYLQFLILYIYDYPDIQITGYYDDATAEAVKYVQKFERINDSGIVDFNCWNFLTDTINRFTKTSISTFLENLNNSKLENYEIVYYQWQLRQTQINKPKKEKFFYELYIFDSYTNERHFISAFCNDNDFYYGNFEKKGKSFVEFYKPVSISVNYVILFNNNQLRVVCRNREPGMQLQNEPKNLPVLFELKTTGNVNFKEKELKKLKVPAFSRKLEKIKGRKNLFGEDIYYLQVILNHYYNFKLDIDGYFGSETEKVVKEFQKNANLDVTGIVDEKLWNVITCMGGSCLP